jgi:hypothetical protein
VDVSFTSCDECIDDILNTIFNCSLSAAGCAPGIGCGVGGFACGFGLGDGEVTVNDVLSCISGALGCTVVGSPFGCGMAIGQCLVEIITTCGDNPLDTVLFSSGLDETLLVANASLSNLNSNSNSNLLEYVEERAFIWYERIEKQLGYYKAILGDDTWFDPDNAESLDSWLAVFHSKITDLSDGSSKISDAERNELLNAPLPTTITGADVNKLVDRWNRSIDYWESDIFNLADVPDGQSTDFIAVDTLSTAAGEALESAQETEAEGFSGVLEGTQAELNDIVELLENNSAGVCAKVRIQINQDAVMTRTAFL